MKTSNNEEQVNLENTSKTPPNNSQENISENINNNNINNNESNQNLTSENLEEEEEENENDEYRQKVKEYIAQIEQLSNELQIEKQITNSIQRDPVQEEIISKLKDELSEKQIKYNQLKSTNEKQKKAIEQLSKELNNTLQKEKDKKNNTNSNLNKKTNPDNNKKDKEEPINIILKIKEKQLNEALAELESLRKKNDEMKTTLEKSNDYNQKLELVDDAKEKEEKLSSLNLELKMLNKEMENHNKCLNEQKEYINVLEQLKKEMKNAKKENMELREKIKENEKKLQILMFGDNENKNKKKNNNIQNTNIQTSNRKKSLPTLKSRLNSVNTVLTEEFLNKLKNAIGDIEEYEILVNKIKDLENGRYKIEKKHKSELNLIGEQINNLDIQYNFLDHKDKENDTENKILKNKINELKNEQKINQKRLIDNQKQLDFLINKSKEKDQEIKLLTMQLNSLRKITKYGNVDPAETEVDEYISKLKKEKENEIIKKNVTSHEQEIQANFDSESENN